MAFASGSGRRVGFVAESTWATTPSNPVFQVMRITNGSVRTQKVTAVSDEIRADRNVIDEILLGQDPAGSYDIEFSYGSFDSLLESALFSTWSSDIIKNGITPKSFTFEETRELGATDSFSRFTGCRVNSFSMSIQARSKITGSIAIMGRQESLATAIVSGATYTAANDNPIVSASAHVAALSVLGISTTPKIRSIDFEINNNIRTRPVVSSQFTEEFGEGRCEITGTMEAYFESNALYQKVLDHANGALEFQVGAESGETYFFEFPKVIIGSGEVTPAGNDEDVMVSMPFRAVYSTSDAASIVITRAIT